MLDTLLFDLDGTLLPMVQRDFTQAYFAELVRFAQPLGYPPQALIDALWRGVQAMVDNDGRATNRERFWASFAGSFGAQALAHEPLFRQFYAGPFHNARRGVLPCRPLGNLMASLRDKGYTLALATNPLFPLEGVRTRLSWAGLTDRDFAWVTTYDNSTYCKPHPRYYLDILRALGKAPDNCLMCGNDVAEDMPAAQAGMAVYLVTDCLEHGQGTDISQWPHGSLAELEKKLTALPNILP